MTDREHLNDLDRRVDHLSREVHNFRREWVNFVTEVKKALRYLQAEIDALEGPPPGNAVGIRLEATPISTSQETTNP